MKSDKKDNKVTINDMLQKAFDLKITVNVKTVDIHVGEYLQLAINSVRNTLPFLFKCVIGISIFIIIAFLLVMVDKAYTGEQEYADAVAEIYEPNVGQETVEAIHFAVDKAVEAAGYEIADSEVSVWYRAANWENKYGMDYLLLTKDGEYHRFSIKTKAARVAELVICGEDSVEHGFDNDQIRNELIYYLDENEEIHVRLG